MAQANPNAVYGRKAEIAGKFLRIYYDVDMRNSHAGLAEIARRGNGSEKGINVDELQDGQYLLFLNNKLNRMKLYAAHGIVAYLRVPTGKIDMHTIQLIPQAFRGGSIDYDKALKTRLVGYFREKGRPLEVETSQQ